MSGPAQVSSAYRDCFLWVLTREMWALTRERLGQVQPMTSGSSSLEPHATLDRFYVADVQTLLEEEPHFSSGIARRLRFSSKLILTNDTITTSLFLS